MSIHVVIAPVGAGLDTLALAFGDDSRRRSAFGLAQEYLNAQENYQAQLGPRGIGLWGNCLCNRCNHWVLNQARKSAPLLA